MPNTRILLWAALAAILFTTTKRDAGLSGDGHDRESSASGRRAAVLSRLGAASREHGASGRTRCNAGAAACRRCPRRPGFFAGHRGAAPPPDATGAAPACRHRCARCDDQSERSELDQAISCNTRCAKMRPMFRSDF